MKKHRSERGIVLIMTVAILAFIVSLVALLCSSSLFTYNIVTKNNKSYALRRRLTNDCILTFNYIKNQPITDITILKDNLITNSKLSFETEYVSESLKEINETTYQYQFTAEAYFATAICSYINNIHSLNSVIIGAEK